MNKRKTGDEWERRACEYLEQQGLVILQRNFRCRQGEIDIVAKDKNTYVFVEVKYRANLNQGQPAEAVTIAKQRTISRVADYYRMKKQMGEEVPIRFDVVGILNQEIVWYRNAFEYNGGRFE